MKNLNKASVPVEILYESLRIKVLKVVRMGLSVYSCICYLVAPRKTLKQSFPHEINYCVSQCLTRKSLEASY